MTSNTNPLKGLRCLGFGRASSDGQTKASIPQQREALEKNCKEREMIWVDFDYETVSGSEPGNRDDITRLLDRKKKFNDYDVLLLWDRARLTRAGQAHGAWLKVEFGRIGVKVVSRTAKMIGSRYDWIEEGLEDDAAHDYVLRLSANSCRGKQAKIRDDMLPYTDAPVFGIDRHYLNAEKKDICIIRTLRDGNQERLHPLTKEVLEVYRPKHHYRKQKTDLVVLVPGAEDMTEMVRFAMEQYHVVGLGYMRIAKLMNERGWLTAENRRFGISAVRRIVHMPVYTGHGISNMWGTGKFHHRDRSEPKEVPYDLGERMSQRRPKEVLRPPEDWEIKEYPKLKNFLPAKVRDFVWERQYDYWVKRANGQLTPKRDKHWASPYWLKQSIHCKEAGKYLVGRSANAEWRYYAIPYYVNAPDPSRPWLSKLVPAELVETKVKELLKETLAFPDVLMPLVHSIVVKEATLAGGSDNEITSLVKERNKLDDQVRFALTNLDGMGQDAVRTITQPIVDQRRAMEVRLAQLRAKQGSGPIDVDATVSAVLSEFADLSAAIDGMSSQVLRNLVQSFAQIEIDMRAWTIELTVNLPTWAIRKSEKIKQVVGVVDGVNSHLVNEDNGIGAEILAVFACSLGKEKHGRWSKPCIQCSRKAA